MFQKEPQVLMAHPGQGIDKFEDLKKLTLFISREGLASYFQWLKADFGFSEARVKPYTSNAQPFLADKRSAMQGYVTSEPYAIEKQAGFKPKVFLIADQGFNSYSTLIETRRELVEKRADLVQRFVDASIIGWANYLYGDNKAANALIKKQNPEPPRGVARARCKMLLTAGTEVSSASATSAAFHRSTSRSTSTARWRGGRCCSAAIRASRMLSRDVTTEAGSFGSLPSMASGTGSSHGHLALLDQRLVGPRLGRAQPGRQRSLGLAVERGQAGVGGDPVEPGAQRRAVLERVVAPPRAQVGLLHQVLGVVDRAHHPVAVREQLAPVRVGEAGEVILGRRTDRRLDGLARHGTHCMSSDDEDRQDVSRRIGEPGDVGTVAARDALVVLVEPVVPEHLHALRGERVDRGVDVRDREVEDRVGRRRVVRFAVDEHGGVAGEVESQEVVALVDDADLEAERVAVELSGLLGVGHGESAEGLGAGEHAGSFRPGARFTG